MRRIGFWVPLLAWCGLIYWLSDQPDLDLHHVTPWLKWGDLLDYPLRKLAHVAVYAVLYLLARRGWPRSASLVFCFLYACGDEWHQTFVPGRSGRVTDVLLDTAAAVAADRIKLMLRPRGE